mmetsp:Transcript_32811/g.82749  ORF Transcript_32811/g.82749 Transcript_32811/m.82749 type:complete len:469 (+) Transcript_32811:108-1514(+)
MARKLWIAGTCMLLWILVLFRLDLFERGHSGAPHVKASAGRAATPSSAQKSSTVQPKGVAPKAVETAGATPPAASVPKEAESKTANPVATRIATPPPTTEAPAKTLETTAVPATLQQYREALRSYSKRHARGETRGTVVWVCPLMWKPGSLCGGLNDRLRGVVHVFNMAVFSNMRFVMTPMTGNFFSLFKDNALDWRVSQQEVDRLCQRGKTVLEWMNPAVIRQGLPDNITADTVLCIMSNQKFDPRVAKRAADPGMWVEPGPNLDLKWDEKPHQHQWGNNGTTLKDVTQETFNFLFKKTVALTDLVTETKERLQWSRWKNIIGIHLRDQRREYGSNKHNYLTINMADSYVQRGLDCALEIEKKYGLDSSSTGWFIASDKTVAFSQKDIGRHGEKLMAQYDSRHNNAKPGHYEKSPNTTQSSHLAYRDFAVLMETGVIGVTEGGYGWLASQVGAKPWFACCHGNKWCS